VLETDLEIPASVEQATLPGIVCSVNIFYVSLLVPILIRSGCSLTIEWPVSYRAMPVPNPRIRTLTGK
jgi:hypothetical protein